MRAAAEILRDEWGIPHVRAESLAGAFFGQGFACAQDRLWQMEHDRRRASGRWAEVVGPVAVARDAFVRRMGIARSAQRDLALLGPDAREMLEAYAAGVNAQLASGAPLPAEYGLTRVAPEPWEPWQSLAVYKLRHAFMGPLYRKLWRGAVLRACGPETLAAIYGGASDVRPDSESLVESALAAGIEALGALSPGDGASNHWALAGSRTASGKPLLAGDPHRTLELPNVYWQNHVRCARFEAIGLSFAGVPAFPHFGHNARVAWCITHGMADDQDLFVERLGARELAAASLRTETVSVRGAAPAEVEILTTARGPIVLGGTHAGVGIALRWPTLAEPDPTFDCLLPMLDATSTAALDRAMRAWVVPCNNLISADVDGSIRYRFRGRVPVRDTANRWTPVAGDSPAHAWRGHVSFDDMPAVTDPESGMLAAANDRPAGDVYLGLDFSGPSRARRIRARLESLSAATADDMIAIHADDVSLVAPLFVRALDELAPASDLAREALALLRRWDARMSPDSVGAALYMAFREQLTLLAGESLGLTGATLGVLGEPAAAPERLALVWNAIPPLLTRRFGCDWTSLAALAFERALVFFEARLGPKLADWRWARVHRTFAWHPLAVDFEEARKLKLPPSVPMGGDGDTVLCGATVPGFNLRATLLSVARYVFDLADWERSGWVVPHGVSGDTAGPHFADQLLAWTELRLVPMRWDWRGIEAAVTSRTALAPPGSLMRLTRAFFARPCLEVAPEMLGLLLVHELPSGARLVGRIVEVEAYLGDGTDAASHSHRGPTSRSKIMFGAPGHFYVYRSMGIHRCVNVVCEPEGRGAAVLLRAAEPVAGEREMRALRGGRDGRELASGPGKLAQAFAVDLAHDGRDALSGALRLEREPRAAPVRICAGPRIGITKSADLPYRFFARDSPHVTRAAHNARARELAREVRAGTPR